MAEKKNILEEALLDIKSIQSALDANTKEILRSIAKEARPAALKAAPFDHSGTGVYVPTRNRTADLRFIRPTL